MFKQSLLVASWFVAGGLAFYAFVLNGQVSRLSEELSGQQQYRQLYQDQLALNTQQQAEFESRIQQLQNNLTGAQTQMMNLSDALQEAREMMVPATSQAISPPADDADQL
ncbi:MAG: hypothetical protein KJN90_10840 [Gammaproteobacteria bacterium]|nr:hypothetical protein [Gammaproteobacteria bacterium]